MMKHMIDNQSLPQECCQLLNCVCVKKQPFSFFFTSMISDCNYCNCKRLPTTTTTITTKQGWGKYILQYIS